MDERKDDMPGGYEAMVAPGNLEARLEEPYPEIKEKVFKVLPLPPGGAGRTMREVHQHSVALRNRGSTAAMLTALSTFAKR